MTRGQLPRPLSFHIPTCRTGSLHSPPQGPRIVKDKALYLVQSSGCTVPVQLQSGDGGGKNRKAEKQAPDQAVIFSIFQISASFILRGTCSSLVEGSSDSMYLA